MTTVVEREVVPLERAYPLVKRRPEYGSAAKAENYYRLAEARQRGNLIVNAAPTQIRIEPHARCNLRCCWAHRDPKHPDLRPRGAMSIDLARRIIDEVGEYLYLATLCHWGEPTLNRDLPEIVRLFHEAGIFTLFHTNAVLIDAEMAGRLIDAGLDHLSASIDGVTQASYEQYRIGGKVERAITGIRDLVQERRRRGATTPVIRWQFLVFPHNEHEYEAARSRAEEIGVDEFTAFGADGREWTPQESFTRRDPLRHPQRPAGQLCDEPWTEMTVDWDGAVQVCCRAYQAKYVMGHITEGGLLAIFNNERYQIARRVVRDGTWRESNGPIPCTGCNKTKHFYPQIAALNHFNLNLV